MADTLHRAYPRPDTSRTIAEEFPVSDQALVAIDADIHELFEAILGLAPLDHTHDLADVAGLIDALAGKAATSHTHALDDLDDVSGAAGAANGYVLVKTAAGWIPGSPASVIGSHQHAMTDVVNLDAALDNLAAAAQINAAAVGAGLDGNDYVGFRQNADGAYVKYTWSTMRAGVVVSFGGNLASRTAKPIVVDADFTVLGDTQAANATKKVTFLELWDNYFKVKANALYQPLKTILTTLGNLANASGYLKNNGAGVLSWGTPPSLSLIREAIYEASGNFVPNANASAYEFRVVGRGGNGNSGGNGNQGYAGGAAGAIIASGSKAEVGNADLAVTIGTAGVNTTPGTPTTVGSLVTANSGRNLTSGSNSAVSAGTGSTNLAQSTAFTGEQGGQGTLSTPIGAPVIAGMSGYGHGGRGGNSGNTNQSSSGAEQGGPAVVVIREYR